MTLSQNKRPNLTSLDLWYHRRGKALERLVEILGSDEEKEEDELNRALDALALAHIAATFEWGGGPIEW
jgi:hypothetical protein